MRKPSRARNRPGGEMPAPGQTREHRSPQLIGVRHLGMVSAYHSGIASESPPSTAQLKADFKHKIKRRSSQKSGNSVLQG